MKTTVELPDDLARRIKAAAALRGRKLKDLVAEGLRLVLAAAAAKKGNQLPLLAAESMRKFFNRLHKNIRLFECSLAQRERGTRRDAVL